MYAKEGEGIMLNINMKEGHGWLWKTTGTLAVTDTTINQNSCVCNGQNNIEYYTWWFICNKAK